MAWYNDKPGKVVKTLSDPLLGSSPPGLCSTLERAACRGRARYSRALCGLRSRARAVLQPAALPDSSCLQSALLVCRTARRVLPLRASASSGFCSAARMTSSRCAQRPLQALR